MKPAARFLRLCLLACISCLAAAELAAATSTTDATNIGTTQLTDVPLRTSNRAKPNILFFIDNGQQTQWTSSPDAFANAFTNLASTLITATKANDNSATVEYTTQFSSNYLSKSGGTPSTLQINNWNNDQADTDWHYRASGNYAKGGSCASNDICTLKGNTAKQTSTMKCSSVVMTAKHCTDVFNQLYYDPTYTYVQPIYDNGATSYAPLPLPQTQYATPAVAQNSNCNCTNLQQCAWLDGFDAKQKNYVFPASAPGCVDLSSNFSTTPYPYLPRQLLPWSQSGAAPASPNNGYVPSLPPFVKLDGTVTQFIGVTVASFTSSMNSTLSAHAPVLPPGSVTFKDSGYSPEATIYAPGAATIPAWVTSWYADIASWYTYNQPGSFSFSFSCTVGTDCPAIPGTASSYFPPTCVVDPTSTFTASCSNGSSANNCTTKGLTVTASGTFKNMWCRLTRSQTGDAPSLMSSPVYCDVSSQWNNYIGNSNLGDAAQQQACQSTSATNNGVAAPVYANPGPADFFDPDGTRHVITNAADQGYFYSSLTDETKNNFAIWHSFYRTRLLALKTALNLSIGSNLDGNFRVGLAAMANSSQTNNTPTFGACSDSSSLAPCHTFSPVADFTDGIIGTDTSGHPVPWKHRSEWYSQLAKIQPSSFVGYKFYLDNLHRLYRWFAGVQPDPDQAGYWPPDTNAYPTQAMANTTFNTGADSQYACNVDSNGNPILNSNGSCSTATGHSGPAMYSCQPNTLIFMAADVPIYTPIANATAPAPNLAVAGSGCQAPTYATAYSGRSICDFSNKPVTSSASWPTTSAYGLPPYVLPFCDAMLSGIPGATPCTGGSGNSKYSGGYITAGAGFPFPMPGSGHYSDDPYSTDYGYSSTPLNSMADLSLYYWSHDLNQEFNNQNTKGGVVHVAQPDGSGILGVQTSRTDKGSWAHVSTYFLNLGLSSQCDYSAINYPIPANCDPATSTWPVPSASDEQTQFWNNPRSNLSTYSTAVDDMAHAAFNGHGKYYQASGTANGTNSLQNVLSGLFSQILTLSGSESAVAVANTQVKATSTANYAFQSFYGTSGWWGDLRANPIDPTSGTILYDSTNVSTAVCPNRQSLNQGYVCWSALQQLRASLCPGCTATKSWDSTLAGSGTRRIISDNGGASSPGIEFTSGALAAGYGTVLNTTSLTGSTSARDTANLVAYLRGDNTNESCVRGPATCTVSGMPCYRCRYIPATPDNVTVRQSTWNPLGDIVDAEAVAIAPPAFSFSDASYQAFKTAQASRPTVIYQGADDGMLHAFNVGSSGDATGGNELWAYVPSFVINNLHALANPCNQVNPDSGSCSGHKYFVNASPAFGDVDFNNGVNSTAGTWHTILVGGLGKGGRGYYALDVTTVPSAIDTQSGLTAKVLWTFPKAGAPDLNVGYTYGRPAVVKVQDMSGNLIWAVVVSSGYNNGTATLADGSDGSDGPTGKGHIYVLDARDGSKIADLTTPCDTNPSHSDVNNYTFTCSATTPSGLAYFAVQVNDPPTDRTAQAVFAGDLLGNVWKFGLSGLPTTWQGQVTRLASLIDSTGIPQPVTSEPEIAKPDGTTLMVFVGTGRYLGTNDVPNGQLLANRQTVYALKASGVDYVTPNLGARGTIAAARQIDATNSAVFGTRFCSVQSTTNRCLAPTATSSTAVDSWLFDLPIGERVITNPQVVLGSLIFTSSVPLSDPCQPGGKSYFYMLDYRNGGMIPGSTSLAQTLLDPITGDSIMASRPTVIQLPDGRIEILASTAVGTTLTKPGQPPTTRRISWREVPN